MAGYVIIGIHGLANKPKRTKLEKWWQDAILEGLQRNEGRSAAGSIDFELVYWRPWNYPNPIPDGENDEPYFPDSGSGKFPLYEDDFWDTLRAEAGDLADTPIDWAKRLFKLEKLAQGLLKSKLPDLALYYADEKKRDKLRKPFADTILKARDNQKRIMVIAHSMGSIVAYDVLRKLGRTEVGVSIDHFVTIGSPLGLPHVKFKIWEESDLVRTPSVVRRWTNLSDRRDPVCFDTHLSGDFKPNDKGVEVQDDLVLNDYKNKKGKGAKANPHKSYGYLRTPELSKLIRSFI